MKSSERIEKIIEVRAAQGLSIQQFADMCQLSASTVYRALSGKTVPEEYTLQTMEAALGITDKPTAEPILPAAALDPTVEKYINTLLVRIERLRAHYNMLLASKSRWIALSVVMNVILIMFLLCVLIYDMTDTEMGWVNTRVNNLGLFGFGLWRM